MLYSKFQTVVQEMIDKEDIDIKIEQADKFKDFVKDTERELDSEINRLFDHLKSRISEMDHDFNMDINDRRDDIIKHVKENLFKS